MEQPPVDYVVSPGKNNCDTCGSYDSNLKEGMCAWCHSHFTVSQFKPSIFRRIKYRILKFFK